MIDLKELKELRKAIRDGDAKKVKNLLKRSPDLASDWRPVHEACTYGHVEIMRHLIRNYADVDAKASHGNYRPLHRAIQPDEDAPSPNIKPDAPPIPDSDHKAIVEMLLKNGADIEARGTPYLVQPLVTAAFAGKKEMVKLLLSKGAKVNLFSASALGDLKKVKEFLAEDKDVIKTRDVNGWTALHFCAASRMGEKDAKVGKDLKAMAELFIKGGLDATTRADTAGRLFAPLRLALFNLPVAEVLLSNKADPNLKDQDGRNVLHAAAARGQCIEMVKLLLKHGANQEEKDDQGRTALEIADAKKHAKVFKALGGKPPPPPPPPE